MSNAHFFIYNFNMNILDDLKSRTILKDITNVDKFNQLKGNEGVYIGFDPTATSLHLGNYVQIAILKRFEKFGFKPVAILGGATGMIGDPSGKSAERNLLDVQALEKNKTGIRNQLEKYGLKVLDNYDFYKNMNVLDFLRIVGKQLNVNYMINKEVVASRLETGISFTEFSYQLIQGWDFKELYEKENVRIQVGGSDQWGNITSGIEIIRKTFDDKNLALGITTNLLTTSSGAKFGKSEGNALWLDPKMTTPYELYQYLISSTDEDVEKYLKWLTFLPQEEIEAIMKEHMQAPFKRFAQNKLAFEVVKDIHSEKDAKESVSISEVIFGKKNINELTTDEALSLEPHIPSFKNVKGPILDVIVEIQAAVSKREAREFLTAGSIEINGTKVTDENYILDNNAFDKKANIIKRGKKKTFLITY